MQVPHRQLRPSEQALSLSHRCKKCVSLVIEGPPPEVSEQLGAHRATADNSARTLSVKRVLVDFFGFMILFTNDALARIDDDADFAVGPLAVFVDAVDAGAQVDQLVSELF